ncbi:MAG: methyltransferase domain-containing protein [Candidatus Uhrbacteria bacterium]|nr:methyltransferase domain-containing protein [Candidatus Uhrbacteria bacterium]
MDRSDRAKQCLLEQLHDEKSLPILDVGCGYGELLTLLSQDGFSNLTGIDGDAKAIERVYASIPTMKDAVIFGDMRQMPYSDQSFSAALCLDVIEYLKGKEGGDKKTAHEIARVLKPDGLFVGSVPYTGMFCFLSTENIMSRLRFQKPKNHHYSVREIRELLNDDFVSIQFERRGMGLSQLVFLVTYPLRPFFRPSLTRFQKVVSQWEFSRQFGIFSYHLFFYARKRSPFFDNTTEERQSMTARKGR